MLAAKLLNFKWPRNLLNSWLKLRPDSTDQGAEEASETTEAAEVDSATTEASVTSETTEAVDLPSEAMVVLVVDMASAEDADLTTVLETAAEDVDQTTVLETAAEASVVA